MDGRDRLMAEHGQTMLMERRHSTIYAFLDGHLADVDKDTLEVVATDPGSSC